MQDFNSASHDFTKAISLSPNNAEYYFYRANAYKNLGNNQEANVDLTKAISINPKFAQAYFLRSFVNYSLRYYKQTVADCETAISLNGIFKDKLTPLLKEAKSKLI